VDLLATGGLGYVLGVASGPPDREARVALALPPLDPEARGRALDLGFDLADLNAEDPDDRSLLIRLAHPELDDAVNDGRETVLVGGEEMNPRLHFALHEVVATQIIDNDPPDAFATAQRLLAAGRDHHEVLHMLGFVVSGQLWGAMHDRPEYSPAEYLAALAALPDSFDEAFPRPPNRAARRAETRRRHRHRRR
jgi:hypothetical protein